MIAVDSSVLISFLDGDDRPEVATFVSLLAEDKIVLPPPTITEVLSDPNGGAETRSAISGISVMPLQDGFWHRAGLLRAAVLRTGAKAKLGDCLLAQACLDADVPLLTRDRDFAAIARIAGLRLA